MAQEREKRRIVIASILKPIDDTRMFEKMGRSLAAAGHEVTIIGYPSGQMPADQSISFISLKSFPRMSWQRLVAKWVVYRQVRQRAPDIFIFNTHELLLPAVMYRLITGRRVYYDVRENYFRNILFSGSFRNLTGILLSFQVRAKEKLLAPMVSGFLLAEPHYADEFGFHKRQYRVVANKAIRMETSPCVSSGEIQLIFTGTLDDSTGVFEAVEIARKMHAADNRIRLHIIGYAARTTVQRRLYNLANTHSFLTLTGIDRLVPHHQILAVIQVAQCGIITYRPSLHTEGSYPTKLYEYLAAGLPIVLNRSWPWEKEFAEGTPFIHVEDPSQQVEAIQKTRYTPPATGIYWEEEIPSLTQLLDL